MKTHSQQQVIRCRKIELVSLLPAPSGLFTQPRPPPPTRGTRSAFHGLSKDGALTRPGPASLPLPSSSAFPGDTPHPSTDMRSCNCREHMQMQGQRKRKGRNSVALMMKLEAS